MDNTASFAGIHALSVYDGRIRIGSIRQRKEGGFGAFDAKHDLIGILPTMKAAADRVSEFAAGGAR